MPVMRYVKTLKGSFTPQSSSVACGHFAFRPRDRASWMLQAFERWDGDQVQAHPTQTDEP